MKTQENMFENIIFVRCSAEMTFDPFKIPADALEVGVPYRIEAMEC